MTDYERLLLDEAARNPPTPAQRSYIDVLTRQLDIDGKALDHICLQLTTVGWDLMTKKRVGKVIDHLVELRRLMLQRLGVCPTCGQQVPKETTDGT